MLTLGIFVSYTTGHSFCGFVVSYAKEMTGL